MYYSRGDACGTYLISLHTPFTLKLFISTASYSVKVYGPDIESEDIISMGVKIQGEDGLETKLKYLTNIATEGYEMLFTVSSADLAVPRSGEKGRLRELSLHPFVDKIRGLVHLNLLNKMTNVYPGSWKQISGYPNTEMKRVENTKRRGVFLTQFEVFG